MSESSRTRLTLRQAETFQALEGWWEAHGHGPTLEELGGALGVRAATVQEHLEHLERAGLAERLGGPGTSRRWAPR